MLLLFSWITKTRRNISLEEEEDYSRRRQFKCIQKQTVLEEEEEERVYKHSKNNTMVYSSNYNNNTRKKKMSSSSIISIFVSFLLLVFSSTIPAIVLAETHDHHKNNQTFRPLEELQKLKAIQAHLRKVNKPAIKTIESPDGDLIDCVITHEQPAFDHPNLIGQKPLDAPDRPHGHNPKGRISESFQLWTFNGETCPEGTIPIRRTKEEDILRASSVNKFGKKISNHFRRDSSSSDHE
ncbi:hypothetical protein MKW94_021042, partial [Papaver nudicaule]|nr:hypothetical protein [Papaver nudicaule]